MASRTMPAPSRKLLRSLRSSTASQGYPIGLLQFSRHVSYPVCPNRQLSPQGSRPFSATCGLLTPGPSTLPKTSDRGPKPTEDTVTDFNTMDVLSATPPPTTTIDACLHDGFHFGNGLKISGGSGCLLVGGEAFSWRPWEGRADKRKSMLNKKGQWSAEGDAWGLLDLIWPKPG